MLEITTAPDAHPTTRCANCGKSHGKHARVRDWNNPPIVRWFCSEYAVSTTSELREPIPLLEQASAACDALRRTTAEGFTDDQRHAWSVAMATIRALADYVEELHHLAASCTAMDGCPFPLITIDAAAIQPTEPDAR